MAENRVIGRDNDLPWHLPADLKRFRNLTMGHALIMGRKTFEAIGKPLPGRRMIVLSRNAALAPQHVEIVPSIERALELVAESDRAYVGGGADIYRQVLPLADELLFTIVHEVVPGDVHFPQVDMAEWELCSSDYRAPDARNRYPHSFCVYRRRTSR